MKRRDPIETEIEPAREEADAGHRKNTSSLERAQAPSGATRRGDPG